MKILHLIDALDFSGSARQIQLLGPTLPHHDLQLEICSLGAGGPWVDSLRQFGVTVHTLDWTRWFDPGVLWNLRELLRRGAPDLVHVWRLPALRALALVARDLLPRVVMSAPLPARGRLAWWDRELLKRVRCLAVAGVSDQARCVQQGIAVPPLRVVPPAALPALDQQPSTRQAIAFIGRLERDEGARNAVWGFDLLRHLYPEHQLLVIGAGSMLEDIHALAVGMGNAPQVQFLGNRTDLAAILNGVPVAWILSTANCGRQAALDAMSAGCAVIASDVPCMRDIILDGVTGFLVPVGDVTQPGRLTHRLFQDADLLERIRAAARRHVAQRHSIPETADRWRELYRSAA